MHYVRQARAVTLHNVRQARAESSATLSGYMVCARRASARSATARASSRSAASRRPATPPLAPRSLATIARLAASSVRASCAAILSHSDKVHTFLTTGQGGTTDKCSKAALLQDLLLIKGKLSRALVVALN